MLGKKERKREGNNVLFPPEREKIERTSFSERTRRRRSIPLFASGRKGMHNIRQQTAKEKKGKKAKKGGLLLRGEP